MPAFTETTPRIPQKFGTMTLSVPAVFTEGDVMSASVAAWVNRQIAGRVANAFGGAVRKAVEAAPKVKGQPAPTAATLGWDFQHEFDTLFASYELVPSNRGTGGGAKDSGDPIERMVHFLASEALKRQIIAKGLQVGKFQRTKDPENTDQTMFTKLLTAYKAKHVDALRAQAEAQLSALGTDDDLGDVDLAA